MSLRLQGIMSGIIQSLSHLDLDLYYRKIGEGSFGEVVLANYRGTKVAAKRLRGFEENEEGAPSPTFQPVLAQFFEREIEILATIRHPNVRHKRMDLPLYYVDLPLLSGPGEP